MRLIYLLLALLSIIIFSHGQLNENCSLYFRNVRRGGMYTVGKLEIPLDDQFPHFTLRLKFSRSIHSITVRQMQARDMGTHTEFMFDPMDQVSNGVLQLNAVIRMRSMRSATPKITRIVYNNRALCGDPLTPDEISESVVVESPTSVVSIIIPSTSTTEATKRVNATTEEDAYEEFNENDK